MAVMVFILFGQACLFELLHEDLDCCGVLLDVIDKVIDVLGHSLGVFVPVRL